MGSHGKLTKHATRFNKSLLQYLACPLSKEPLRASPVQKSTLYEVHLPTLRYCEKPEELVSDIIGVAFPIIDGIPCLVSMQGRVLDSSRDEPSSAR